MKLLQFAAVEAAVHDINSPVKPRDGKPQQLGRDAADHHDRRFCNVQRLLHRSPEGLRFSFLQATNYSSAARVRGGRNKATNSVSARFHTNALNLLRRAPSR